MAKRDREMLIKYKGKNGQEVTLCQTIFLINTKNPDGTPALCTQIGRSQSIDLAGEEEFMSAWVPYNMRAE